MKKPNECSLKLVFQKYLFLDITLRLFTYDDILDKLRHFIDNNPDIQHPLCQKESSSNCEIVNDKFPPNYNNYEVPSIDEQNQVYDKISTDCILINEDYGKLLQRELRKKRLQYVTTEPDNLCFFEAILISLYPLFYGDFNLYSSYTAVHFKYQLLNHIMFLYTHNKSTFQKVMMHALFECMAYHTSFLTWIHHFLLIDTWGDTFSLSHLIEHMWGVQIVCMNVCDIKNIRYQRFTPRDATKDHIFIIYNSWNHFTATLPRYFNLGKNTLFRCNFLKN